VQSYLFESVADPFFPHNWGAFLVAVFDEIELGWRSRAIPAGVPLSEQLGWTREQAWVMDLRTGEGAMFTMGGDARADLEMHRIYVTAPFEGFLEWLYTQNLQQLYTLPPVVKVADATFSIKTHRRLGPFPVSFTMRKGDTFDLMWAGEARTVTCDGITEDGASIRDLTEDEMRQLMAGPEDADDPELSPEDADAPEPGPEGADEPDPDEPHELDYEEMREGLPPPWAPGEGDGDGQDDGEDAAAEDAAGPEDEPPAGTPAASTRRGSRRRAPVV
jgi:hypothetical protein